MFDSLIDKVYLPCVKEFGFDKAVQILSSQTVAKMAFISKYKRLPAIEIIPEERKMELWKYDKENFPGRSKDELIETVKIVYTISALL